MEDTLFASRTLREHYVRGAVGTVLAVGAFALLGLVGPWSLLLLVPAGLAWRGCISCWALGLTQTKARLAAEQDGTCVPCNAGRPRAGSRA